MSTQYLDSLKVWTNLDEAACGDPVYEEIITLTNAYNWNIFVTSGDLQRLEQKVKHRGYELLEIPKWLHKNFHPSIEVITRGDSKLTKVSIRAYVINMSEECHCSCHNHYE